MKVPPPSLRNSRLPANRVVAALLFVLLALPGCAVLQPLDLASLNPFDSKNGKYEKADAKHPVNDMLAIWQEAEGAGLNGIPTRGFAGQIFFFTPNRSQPVLVDGKVRIYLFDDRGTAKEQGRPIHIFDFDSQAWAAHLHASNMGPSYAVFIPYTREDFHQANCALRIRFTPATGSPSFSPLSTVVLNGPPLKAPEDETPATAVDLRKNGSTNRNTSLAALSRPPHTASQVTSANAISVAEASSADQSFRNHVNSRDVILAVGTESDRQLSLDNTGQSPAAGDLIGTLAASSPPVSASGAIKLEPAGPASDDDTPLASRARPSVNATDEGPPKRQLFAD